MNRRTLFVAFVVIPLFVTGCNDPTPTGPVGTVGLGIGQIAPALEGEDLEGKPHRLSDYRGKVVVVDFWATWCGPCRQLIPHEKSLVKRMEGKPFAFLGVSADRTRGDLAAYLSEDPLPWPNIFDGEPPRPLVTSWQIKGYPSIFVIDAKGVIRYRDVTGAQLDRAVTKLVAEAEGN